MGWSHPDILIEDFVNGIKGFVDIIILASGYQSSGLPAIWDVDNIKKAVRWGFFFEDVLKNLQLHGNYEESVKDLDAALLNLKSDPNFPLGLAHISSKTLSNAKRFVLRHFLQANPIKGEHLVAFLRAVVEMDIDELLESHNDCPKVYIDKLTLQLELLELAAGGRGLRKLAKTLLPRNDANTSKSLEKIDQNFRTQLTYNAESMRCIDVYTSFYAIKTILSRQAVMSHLSAIEKGFSSLSKIITGNKMGSENIKFDWKSADDALSDGDDILIELHQFSQWKSRCLSYLLDQRTIKLLSGAELIFQAPKEQWIRIFEGLKTSSDPCYDNLLEILEILLLGLLSNKQNYLTREIIPLTCDFVSPQKKLSELHEVFQRNIPVSQSNKEKDILDYLTSLLIAHPDKLWNLPSVLVAAAIPPWSILFRTFLCDVENHYNKYCSSKRCHGCNQLGSKHQNCEVNDRIQSLYIFHIRCFPGKG